ncbi:hypothetical protein ACFQJ3_13500 [Salinibaculum sp. GCM10025337]
MTGARIPFALVGVVLLLGSATFAGSLTGQPATGPAVGDALDTTAAETQSAVRDAVTAAARAAATDPITDPAGTRFGAVLNTTSTFRDSLRIRVYLAVRDRLQRLDGDEGIDVTARLPPTPTPAALRDAKRRVSISRAGPRNTALRATVSNVTLTATRDGRVVGTRTLSPTVTVPVPTLVLHDRVDTFERRLDAGPGDPGLGARLTGRLYPLVWARGYAQYGGTPIENVLANRHVGLFTNGALLAMQRDFFGRSDRVGQSVLGWATANTALTDAIDGGSSPVADRLSQAHDDLQGDRLPSVAVERAQSRTSGASPQEAVTIGVNETADRAFLDTVAGLNRTLRQPYTVAVQRRSRVLSSETVSLRQPRSPGSNWTLVGRDVTNRTAVDPLERDSGTVDGPWHLLASHSRWVNVTTTVTRRWRTPDGHRQTVERRRRSTAVGITLVGRHDTGETPVRPFGSVHERGGPLDGSNLADVRSEARQVLLPGGADAVARRVAGKGGGTASATVVGDRPATLSRWVYHDIVTVRERVRNLSVTVSRGELATLQANPAERLLKRLADRRAALLDVPDAYDGVASRARVAARRAYLDRVRRRLEVRAAGHAVRRSRVADQLSESDGVSLETLQSGYESRDGAATASLGADGVQMRVTTSPSYLTLGELSGTSVAGIPEGTAEHPLVARNRNLFAVPYGDAADAVTEVLFGPDRTRLRTAAQVLDSARVAGLDVDETALRQDVAAANDHLRSVAAETLETVVPTRQTEPTEVLDTALGRWDGPATRAMALSNGSAAAAIATVATERWKLSARTSDRLALVLDRDLTAALETKAARPPQSPVEKHAGTLRRLGRSRANKAVGDAVKQGVKRGAEAVTGKTLSRLPAGLPLAPVPPAWYLTVNYWEVEVAGEYARFVVSAPRGTPDEPGATLRYVRDGTPVALDVDDDGAAERLGAGTRVSFRTHTSVAVAVPPGSRGVGDVDGQMTETSPGWPTPGRAG